MNTQEKRLKEAILRHTRMIVNYKEQLELLNSFEPSPDVVAAIESTTYYMMCEEAMVNELKEDLTNL